MDENLEDITSVMRVDDKDWFLQSLVNTVNCGQLSFGITLIVGGLLVSGQVIGGKEYFELFADAFSGGSGENEEKGEIWKAFAKLGQRYENKDEDDNELKPVHYIHLKEAKFYSSAESPIPTGSGVLWRGRVSEVDGFTLGSLSQS